MSCIFCAIATKEAEQREIIYEDDLILAFPDKYPVSEGHTLVITKKHYANIFEIPADVLQKLMVVCQKIAKDLTVKYRATGINIMHASGKDAEQSVMHIHFHVVPRFPNDNLEMWFHSRERK